jgi:hypothetical protein
MKRWILIGVLAVGWAFPARATELSVDLTVNLVKPSNQTYLNIESCTAADETELEISWTAQEADIIWSGGQDADVFLASDESCSSALVEIGKKAGEGVDVTISEGQASGNFPLSSDDLFLSDVTGLDCATENEHDYYFCIKWEFEVNNGLYTDNYTFRGGAPIRFDTKPPGAPAITSVDPGESNLKVRWDKPSDDDLDSYILHYREEGTTEDHQATETNGEATSFQITGLTNDVTYEVWMTAVDVAMNESEDSNTMTGTPEPVEDFFEYYRGQGGGEDGGFCFVATAAYGSYQDAMVVPLRAFRDSVLMPTATGRGLVAAYYRFGPRWARAIRGSDLHRAAARLSLAPLVVAARADLSLGTFELLVLLAALLILGLLGKKYFQKMRRSARASAPPALMALIAALLVMGVGSRTRAQDKSHPGTDSDSGEAVSGGVPNMQFQVRFGPYTPQVDSEKDLSGKPFKEIFGGGSEMLFELGLDYEIWRGFGVVSVGGSFGFVQYLGKGRTQSGDKSSDTTVFNLVPFRLNVGYTFDKLMDWWRIPFEPYVVGGLDYYVWWVLDGVGDIASYEDESGKSYTARGGIFGGHFSVGLKLLLDVLDQEAASHLENQVGVMNSFFFAEYSMSWIDQFGASGHMNVGDQTFMFGLMMEF